jgi:hypothetical protein
MSNVRPLTNDLVNISIRCRCGSLVTYQCSSPLPGGSPSEIATQLEIPLFCYYCARLVTKLYVNSTIKAPNVDTQSASNVNSSITLSVHPQEQMNKLLAGAQASSLVSPPITQPIRLMNLGFNNVSQTATVSGLPKLDSNSIETDTDIDEDTAVSPSSRPGTIVPMT